MCGVSFQLVIGERGIFPINFFAARWKRSTIIKNPFICKPARIAVVSIGPSFESVNRMKTIESVLFYIFAILLNIETPFFSFLFCFGCISFLVQNWPMVRIAVVWWGRRVVGAGGEMWWAGLGGQPEPTTALACESPPAWALAHL